jgi:hypothetical protein
MTLTNRLFTIGLSIGLFATSATAMAHGSREHQPHVASSRVFAQMDDDRDGLISFNEAAAFEWAHARAEFARRDLNADNVLSVREQMADDDCEANTTIRPHYRQVVYRTPLVRFGWEQRPQLSQYRQVSAYRQITSQEMRLDMIRGVKALFRELDGNGDRQLSRAEMARAQVRETVSGVSLIRALHFEA